MKFRPKTFCLLAVLTVAALFSVEAATTTTNLPLPPRLQWNANYGYCGETSFISAGLYYGQYCSQFTARSLASPGVAQSKASSQLLLGVNDTKAAAAMHLAVTPWPASSRSTAKDFLTWIETQVVAGKPVAIGIFTNEYRFYGSTSPTAGDPDYDHIVPVTGISGSTTYEAANKLTFSDNGLWSPGGQPQYLFTSTFGTFPLTRQQANAKTGPVYSLKSTAPNYGIAFNGVLDTDKVTIPVRVTTSVNSELPAMKDKSNTPPAAGSLTLTVTVTIPNQDVEYNLYQYNNFANVPDRSFNANQAKATARWRINRRTGPTFTVTVPIKSSDTAAFRAVPVTAK